MVEKIRQFFLSIIGIITFAFVFYLVFRDDQKFMIVFLISLGGLILLFLIVGLILKIKDNLEEKKRLQHFKHHSGKEK
ncbi:MAG: hypothetical protein P1P86_14835 [Bacteroidales bacterium]|nr:hypothetical protein [Bacteroidales bacterium]